MTELELRPLARPHMADTGVWLWIRDRRFPELRRWFSGELRRGLILTAPPVVLELVRGAPSPAAAAATAQRLDAVGSVGVAEGAWTLARELQLALSETGDHRRVPVVDLVLGAACSLADVPILHYDADFERIAGVGTLEQRWLVERGALA